ncbi:MAG: hypothetical protein QNJ38_00360 [Prochloraceae cyanobacterium]|nr:hypothetical protein [Prochloraceae cyanobacterium]
MSIDTVYFSAYNIEHEEKGDKRAGLFPLKIVLRYVKIFSTKLIK